MTSNLMRRSLAGLALSVVLTTGAAAAEARQVRYVGHHPNAERGKSALCFIEAPHVHAYAPAKAEILYRNHDGDHYFVGDPVPYGYDGPRHAYYGHHPIHADVLLDGAPRLEDDPELCYLDGPHFHGFAPPEGATFRLTAGAYWFIGPYPASYQVDRPRYVGINAVYRPLVYDRPEVVFEAPPVGYVGPVVALSAPVVEVHAPAVEVHAPAVRAGIDVHIPVPTIEVGIGLPAVLVGGHGHVQVDDRGRRHRGKHKGHKRRHRRDHRE